MLVGWLDHYLIIGLLKKICTPVENYIFEFLNGHYTADVFFLLHPDQGCTGNRDSQSELTLD
jgi:hypothetical protein